MKTLTKPDKTLEDRRELGLLFVSIDVSKNRLERIEMKIQNSKAETKRLKKIFKTETKKLKKYQNDYKNKSELFRENYGKFRQLRLLIK
jgi:multidrug resistance efflux pump